MASLEAHSMPSACVCHMPRQALKRAAIPVVPLAFGALSPYAGEASAAKKKKKEKRKVGAMLQQQSSSSARLAA